VRFIAYTHLFLTPLAVVIHTGLRKDDQALQNEMLSESKKKKSILDPDALASQSEDDLGHTHGRRPSFEAEMFGDAPSNAAEALMNDKELAGV
jgi:hypothetical protein